MNSNLQKLKIEHFGPIVSTGKNHITFKRCTVFIGDQGTGKSTIVKVYSTLTWIEKAIISKKIYKKLSISDVKKLFTQQNIPEDYFVKNTLIEYINSQIKITITNIDVNIEKKNNDDNIYVCPKIQYVPSERNVLSTIENLNNISGLSEMVLQYNNEFNLAKNNIISLDFQGFILKYDKKKYGTIVVAKESNSKVKLSQASSGVQSVYPLLFVSRYLKNTLSLDVLSRLKMSDPNRRQEFLNLLKDDSLKNNVLNYLTSGIKNDLLKSISKISKNDYEWLINSCFIEIVEEPEQNLFPISQVEVIKNLIIDTNGKNDKLVITTHSPYILSQLNNYIFANSQYINNKVKIKEIPNNLFLDFNGVSAYKISSGKVKSIIDNEYGGIDVLEIDECSRIINKVFAKLFKDE